MTRPATADLYWSFRSPYSYLATRRYRALAEDLGIEIRLRPVYPLAIRQPDFFERNHPNWLRYTILDCRRLADYLGLPLMPPRPDPIVQDIASRRIADDQPHIRRVTRLGAAAARRGKGLAYADHVSRLIWGGTEGWNTGPHLADAARAAGLDPDEIEAEARTEADALDAAIASNQTALEAAGHWGVPTLVYDGEPFFGQDRIELAAWRMRGEGADHG